AGDYYRHGALGTFLARLDVGVAIFFVLSGFLLARPWIARAAEGQDAPAAHPYLWKRLLRIAPLYVVTVVIALSLIGENQERGPADWVVSLLMLDSFTADGAPAGLTQMWSLAVEVCFYLVLPALMVLLVGRHRALRPGRVLAGLAAMSALSVWWHLDGAARASELSLGNPRQWLPAYLGWFAAGILLALAHVVHTRGSPPWTRGLVTLARQPGSCWILVVGLMLVTATPLAGPTLLIPPTAGESLLKNLVYGLVGLLVVMTGVFAIPGGLYERSMGHGSGRRLGWISYGIFCLHLPLLHFVMWSTGWTLFEGRGFQIWALVLVLSIVAAELTYRLVERPALRLKRLVPDRSSNASRSSSPTSGTTIA
ncbi:acyltransferase, partial [Nocardioides sp.]|uniref:acyltransferase family protein n=1 Tax=Nocardioides sp. TaxID=35761 RepID=UPI0027355426